MHFKRYTRTEESTGLQEVTNPRETRKQDAPLSKEMEGKLREEERSKKETEMEDKKSLCDTSIPFNYVKTPPPTRKGGGAAQCDEEMEADYELMLAIKETPIYQNLPHRAHSHKLRRPIPSNTPFT